MRDKPAPDTGAPAGWLAAFHQNLVSHANDVTDLQPTLLMLVQALVDLGLAPQRVSLSLLTSHPSLSGLGYVWTRTSGEVTSFERPAHFLDTPEHLSSPLHDVLTRNAPLFLDAAAMAQDPRFDILRQFASDGATSYQVTGSDYGVGTYLGSATWVSVLPGAGAFAVDVTDYVRAQLALGTPVIGINIRLLLLTGACCTTTFVSFDGSDGAASPTLTLQTVPAPAAVDDGPIAVVEGAIRVIDGAAVSGRGGAIPAFASIS